MTLRTPLPDSKPRVLCNFLTTEEDRASMLAGMRMALEIAAQEPLRAVRAGAVQRARRRTPTRTSWPGSSSAPRRRVYHPTSTCAIGPVVDSAAAGLRVRGAARGRRVGDADDHARQHERADDHDRRARGGPDHAAADRSSRLPLTRPPRQETTDAAATETVRAAARRAALDGPDLQRRLDRRARPRSRRSSRRPAQVLGSAGAADAAAVTRACAAAAAAQPGLGGDADHRARRDRRAAPPSCSSATAPSSSAG